MTIKAIMGGTLNQQEVNIIKQLANVFEKISQNN
jgi:hypothetical protein